MVFFISTQQINSVAVTTQYINIEACISIIREATLQHS